MNTNKSTKNHQSDYALPDSEELNIPALLKIFSRTTSSYKFLFFISILDILKSNDFQCAGRISYVNLTVEMLVKAWAPYKKYQLSFGAQDTICTKIDDLCLNQPVDLSESDGQRLRSAIASADLTNAQRLMDFVPYRLITPFLEDELASVDKGEWMTLELAMPAIANANFLTKKPIYRFDSDVYKECSAIAIHPEWVEYFKAHFAVIHDWALGCWIEYMEKRNPSVDGIADILTRQRR